VGTDPASQDLGPPILRRLAAYEPLLVAVAAPALLFPNRLTPLFALLVLLPWLARLLGRRDGGTPLDGPIALLLAATFTATLVSFDAQLSLPKLYGIVLGVAVYHAIANVADRERALRWLGDGLAAAGPLLALVGLFATPWRALAAPKLFGRWDVLERLPSLADYLPKSALAPQGPGLNPNELGGALALLLPIPLAMLLRDRGRLPARSRGLLTAGLVVMAVVLFVTRSRSAWLGVLVALALLAWWTVPVVGRLVTPRRALAFAAGLAVVFVALGLVVGFGGVFRRINTFSDDTGSPISDRFVLWGRVAQLIGEFPLTGVGLNNLPYVLEIWAPEDFTPDPNVAVVPHAHDLFLHSAVEMGLPGLIAVVWLIVAGVVLARSALRRTEANRALALGCALGLLAFVVYGLTDLVALGAKPSFLIWMLLGTLALIGRRGGWRAPAGWLGPPVLAAAAAVALLAVVGVLPLARRPGWPATGAFLAQQASQRDLVLFVAPPGRAGALPFVAPPRVDTRVLGGGDPTELVRGYAAVWLVEDLESAEAPNGLQPRRRLERIGRLMSRNGFGSVLVSRYDLPGG